MRQRQLKSAIEHLLLFVGLAVWPLGASANDSTAAIGLGGIVLLKQADIAMETEDLAVSPGEIQVRYRFRNHSSQDIDATVAFPLPRFFRGESYFHDPAWPKPYSGNLIDFEVSVNGATIHPSNETRAYSNGEEVTQILHDLGVPLGVGLSEEFSPQLAATLKKAGFLVPRDNNYFGPNWDEQTTFYWRQRFPANSVLAAQHRYIPAEGSEHFSDESDLSKSALTIKPRLSYCGLLV